MKKTIIVAICLSFVVLFCAQIVLAAEVNFKPQITLPGSDFEKGVTTTPSIAKYVQGIYNYAIGIVGILAAVVLMWGGVVWLTSGGSAERVNSAKSWIGAALSGLVLVLTSYLILNTINPDLVNFKPIAVGDVGKFEEGCCEYKDPEGNSLASIYNNTNCDAVIGKLFPDEFISADGTDCIKDGCCYVNFSAYLADFCSIMTKTECDDRNMTSVDVTTTSEFILVASCDQAPKCAGIIK